MFCVNGKIKFKNAVADVPKFGTPKGNRFIPVTILYTRKAIMAITNEVLYEKLKDYKSPEDFIGKSRTRVCLSHDHKDTVALSTALASIAKTINFSVDSMVNFF